jgi:hypothetical protein
VGGIAIGYGFGGQRRARSYAPQGFVPSPPAEKMARATGTDFLGGFLTLIGRELQKFAEETFSSAMQSLRKSVTDHVPEVVDSAVEGMTDRLRHTGNGRHRSPLSFNGR